MGWVVLGLFRVSRLLRYATAGPCQGLSLLFKKYLILRIDCIYEKVHYQQQRINAENAIDYVRLRHRVSCCPILRF